ncbi:hypothetical protein ml_475 [Mollivirus sibericum]|uniref:hypothetical protein n=1 Tax=Mollivirus sibericum TaxID=1678078 RepID=UPI0006B2DCC8|nr:hypothetical protein ml_475 [Mollivirus sibericum]ALD62277.1 hypothetical protein ml_475 [Mollivirus sibericum]
MASPKRLLHLAMAKASSVAQELIETQGNAAGDPTLAEWPFWVFLAGERVCEVRLPYVERPGLVLVEMRNSHQDRLLERVCCLVTEVGQDLSLAGLVASREEEGAGEDKRLAQGSFLVDPSSNADITLSPGTWWHRPHLDTDGGLTEWLCSFRRAEILAQLVGGLVKRSIEMGDALPDQLGLQSLFRHLFHQAVVSRHGAALESGLRSYELIMDLATKRANTEPTCFPVPAFGEDGKEPTGSLSLARRRFKALVLDNDHLLTSESEPEPDLYGILLSDVTAPLLHLAAYEEDPLALKVAEAILTRYHQAFGRIGTRTDDREWFDDMLPRLAQKLGLATVEIMQLERLYMAALVLTYSDSPMRATAYNVLEVSFRGHSAGEGGGEGLDEEMSSIRRSRAFAFRATRRKNEFYDIITAWLNPTTMAFATAARWYLRPYDYDSFLYLVFSRLCQATDTAEGMCARRARMTTAFLMDCIPEVAYKFGDPDVAMQSLLLDLGLPVMSAKASLAIHSEMPLIKAWAQSDGHTHDRLVRIAFHLIEHWASLCAPGITWVTATMLLLVAAHPACLVDPTCSSLVALLHAGPKPEHAPVPRPVPLKSYWAMRYYSHASQRQYRVWIFERLWDSIMRDFFAFCFTEAERGRLATGIDTEFVECRECNAKVVRAMRSFALEGAPRDPVYGFFMSKSNDPCQRRPQPSAG